MKKVRMSILLMAVFVLTVIWLIPKGKTGPSREKMCLYATRATMYATLNTARDFYSEHHEFPKTVDVLVSNGFMRARDVTDAWGNKLMLTVETVCTVRSAGADGVFYTKDDIPLSTNKEVTAGATLK